MPHVLLALLLLAAWPMPASSAGQEPHCWLAPGLIDHVQRWNAAINRDDRGRPLSSDYDLAARLLTLRLPRYAAKRLEKAALDTRPTLDGTGLPEDAAAVAGLLAACGGPPRPARLIDQRPAPMEAHIWRKLSPPSARVMLIRPPAFATSR